MPKGGLLIIEDEESTLNLIKARAEEYGFVPENIWEATSKESAIRIWNEKNPFISVVSLDIKLTKTADGWELLEYFRNTHPGDDFEVLIFSGTFADIAMPLNAVRTQTISLYQKGTDNNEYFEKLSSLSKRLANLNDTIYLTPKEETEVKEISNSDSPILIIGSSGTGKSALSPIIAERSGCDIDRTIPINCASLPVELVEGILFGYLKGMFTGALFHHVGIMMMASGYSLEDLKLPRKHLASVKSPKGLPAYTLKTNQPWGAVILDEIAALHPDIQPKLLHVLDKDPMHPIGTTKGFLPNFRIIAVTNEMTKLQTSFRPDLLRRLTSHVYECKDLADEPDDKIAAIINRVSIPIRREGLITNYARPRLTTDAISYLIDKKEDIIGGYRELKWIVERAWRVSIKRPSKEIKPEITLRDMEEAWQVSTNISTRFKTPTFTPTNTATQKSLDQGDIQTLKQKVAEFLGLDTEKLDKHTFTKSIGGQKGISTKIREIICEGHAPGETWKGYYLFGKAINWPKKESESDTKYANRISNHLSSLFKEKKSINRIKATEK